MKESSIYYEIIISFAKYDAIHELPDMNSETVYNWIDKFKGNMLQSSQNWEDYKFILSEENFVKFFTEAPWKEFIKRFVSDVVEAQQFDEFAKQGKALEMAKILSDHVDDPWTTDTWKLLKVKAYDVIIEAPKGSCQKMKKQTANSTDHKQVLIKGRRPDGTKFIFECDEQIAGLLKEINLAGVPTMFSCQDLQGDGTDVLQVMFSHDVPWKDLKKAVDIIARRYPKRLLCLGQNAYFDPEVIAIPKRSLSKVHFALWCYAFNKRLGKADFHSGKILHVLEESS